MGSLPKAQFVFLLLVGSSAPQGPEVGFSAPQGPEDIFNITLQELLRQQSEILQKLDDQQKIIDNQQTMMNTLQTMVETQQIVMNKQQIMIETQQKLMHVFPDFPNKNIMIGGVKLMWLMPLVTSIAVESFKIDADPVKVEVFDDPNCPDCRKFVEHQLGPVYAELGAIMDVYVNTYGFTVEPLDGDEYMSNRVVECARHYVTDQSVFVSFFICYMTNEANPDPDVDGKRCADDSGVDWSTIKTCAHSQEGIDLVHDAGSEMGGYWPPIMFFPYIIVNGISPDYDAEEHLKQEVCKAYQGTPPPACST